MALELHRWLAIVSAVLLAGAVVESAWSFRGRSVDPPAGSRLRGVAIIALLVTIAGGLGLLLGGARPRELLHVVYAAIAVGALPVAASISRSWDARRIRIATLIGTLIMLVAVLRLFATG
ncbi:MAG TPA: hypothetical protein VFH98_08790 [Candidatus Limnocylindria bacterium]|nr:hypothetical protein [Candidatus Limnocylindria bacterium]